MNSISIEKVSITDLFTDAVVNAANENLWPGGGVCGAIFRAAGYRQLQEACEKIGHCDTGSAVITPGFELSAKYIIHAVGPRWTDGKHGEPELLYGAYARALALAEENCCTSIGLPLISAGIFGYPADQAWRVALKACRDFFDNGGYMEVTFAVLDEDMLRLGTKIYEEMGGDRIAAGKVKTAEKIVGFHLQEEPYGVFSNWHASRFRYAGVWYENAEQYMMAQKVALGGRFDLQKEIMQTSDPKEIKDLAGKDHFTQFAAIRPLWEKHCRHIVKRGVRAKFLQNPEMLEELLATGTALLAECAGSDTIWGIGINLHAPGWNDVSNWNGSNYLGQILMEVREELRREQSEKGAVQYIDYADAAPIPEWKLPVMQLKRIPQYYAAIHTYADQIPAGAARDAFYRLSLKEAEEQLRAQPAGTLPAAGFFEMKQEIYETAHRLQNRPFVSDIFREKPKQWGLRGDPYFWRTLESRFAFDDISVTESELEEKIRAIFREKMHAELTEDAKCYSAEYAHGGMSSGQVSGGWWVDDGIPMLKERLRALREKK
ncbi:MAG: DUF1768 domain-containing protein [Lachnospiraceae bacterium]|nr:DUF1768 domain-containing protein [Lachnospiraceae bacterium]